MKMSVDTRTYTNVILTVIAIALVAIVLDTYRISGATNAQAQGYTPSIERRVEDRVQNDNSNKYDIAVAQATEKVADANRDIASAIRELAGKVDPLTEAIKSAGGKSASPTSAAQPNAGGIEISTTPRQ